MLPQHYKNYIIDLDGTISTIKIDWRDWHPGVVQIFQQFDPQFESIKFVTHLLTNDFMQKYGDPIRQQIRQFTADYELSHYEGHVINETFVRDIKKLANSKNLFLLTSNCRVLADKILAEIGIANIFLRTITRDDVDYVKPDKSCLQYISPEPINQTEYLMIGDTSSDSDFANNSKIDYLDVKFI